MGIDTIRSISHWTNLSVLSESCLRSYSQSASQADTGHRTSELSVLSTSEYGAEYAIVGIWHRSHVSHCHMDGQICRGSDACANLLQNVVCQSGPRYHGCLYCNQRYLLLLDSVLLWQSSQVVVKSPGRQVWLTTSHICYEYIAQCCHCAGRHYIHNYSLDLHPPRQHGQTNKDVGRSYSQFGLSVSLTC